MEKFKRVQFGALSQLMNEIDDWCGTPPPRRFPPRPKGLRDALVSVAIFHLAAQISDVRMRDQIQDLAGQVHAGGGKIIAG